MHDPPTNRASEATAARSGMERMCRVGGKGKKRKESKQVQEVMSFNCKKENGIDGKRVRVKGENVLPNTGTIA